MKDMKRAVKKSSFRRAVCAAVMAALISAMGILLSGCTFLGGLLIDSVEYVEFKVNTLFLDVGDSYDLRNVIDGTTNVYTISVGSTGILSVSGKTITAKAVGRTTVTASTDNNSSTLSVTVREAEQTELTVSSSGDKIQTVGRASAVSFTVEATGEIRGCDVEWYVNGSYKTTLDGSAAYSFTPENAGVFTVKAVVGEYTAEDVVKAYYDVTASGSSSGSLEQTDGDISAITFSADIATDARNPEDHVRWVVDGTTLYEGGEKIFRYVPSAGSHVVELYVNGVKRLINGQPSVTVRAAGKADTPRVKGVAFDNVYPNVYVDYEISGEAEVEITLPNGQKRVFDETDASVSSKFDDGRFDAQGVIDVCASGSARGSYGIRVKALGDGDLISDSEYSSSYTFTQENGAAKTYIETPILDFDLYLTSEEEYIDVLEYYIISRSKTARSPRVDFSCYVAFGGLRTDSEAEALFTNAFEWAATSGSYDNIDVGVRSNILSTSFTVSTVNRPTRQSYTGRNDYEYAEELHAIAPHINYDASKYRPSDHVFPIDTAERTESVSYTDELYYAVEHNTKPMPTAGSAADTVYQTARDVLRKIVTDDMTDVEKAHAIYDWIMWKVTYDTPATEVSRNGEAYSAYYLEGVFGDGSTAITDVSTGNSVKYAPYAVCDGLSKAYSLMCNIEGIPCVRVAGKAGDSLSSAGGHAWNKVYVNGAWYLVDITWGDAQGYIDGSVYELSLHDWLFLTDAQADPTHFEPYESDESYMINVPETTTKRFDIYKQMTYNGVTINCSVEKNEDQAEKLQYIATQFASAYESRSSLYVPGCGTSATRYVGFDIKLHGGLTLTERNASSIVRSAVRRVLPFATVETYLASDDVLVVLIS